MLSLFLLASLVSVNALEDAFYNKIDKCLFDGWTRGKTPVLKIAMKCNGHDLAGLCYSADEVVRVDSKAQFAVCYNKKTLIPEFTGHIVYPETKNSDAGRGDWRNEGGRYGNHG